MIRKIIADGTAEVQFLKEVEKRNGETDKKVSEIVSEIIENVKENGDKAVKEYTEKWNAEKKLKVQMRRKRVFFIFYIFIVEKRRKN